MYVCKDSAARAHAHARKRAHRPAAPRQSSGVSGQHANKAKRIGALFPGVCLVSADAVCV